MITICNKCALLCKQPSGANVLVCPKFIRMSFKSLKVLNEKDYRENLLKNLTLEDIRDRKKIKLLLKNVSNQKNLLRNHHCARKYYRKLKRTLREKLRSRMYHVLKNNKKLDNTLNLTRCTIGYLKAHLESQFKPGMSWSNHGTGENGKGMLEWHIDHIYPCASFNLKSLEEQQICFHWSNLQPLWAIENLKKRDSI